MPLPAAQVVYNTAVSSGLKQAIPLLQNALKKQDSRVAVDGNIGVQTIGVCQAADQRRLVEDCCAAYGEYLRSLPGFDTFGVSWMNRLAEIKQTALEMADPLHAITGAELTIQSRKSDRTAKADKLDLRNAEALELIADELTRLQAELKTFRHLCGGYASRPSG